MELPRVDAIGIVRYPPGYQPSERPRSPVLRLVAAVLLMVFLVVVVATTAISLGRYCLTSDGADTSALPGQRTPATGPGGGGDEVQ
ncbi:MAG TPA: hypothetical protein VH877_31515 [Polyangia bacterium]|jgi:hypothetical protein|nr:hypothetical protein [Polyangia bacterium]